MGADGIYVGGSVNTQNEAAAAASIGAAATTFNPGGGGADTTERISLNLCVLQFLYFAQDTAPPVTLPINLSAAARRRAEKF